MYSSEIIFLSFHLLVITESGNQFHSYLKERLSTGFYHNSINFFKQ